MREMIVVGLNLEDSMMAVNVMCGDMGWHGKKQSSVMLRWLPSSVFRQIGRQEPESSKCFAGGEVETDGNQLPNETDWCQGTVEGS